MLNELIHRLQGQVWIRAESAFPERVLNLCGARDLAFWDLDWESPTAFTCRLSRRDWHTLRRAAANLDCTLSVVGREGARISLCGFGGGRCCWPGWRCVQRDCFSAPFSFGNFA